MRGPNPSPAGARSYHDTLCRGRAMTLGRTDRRQGSSNKYADGLARLKRLAETDAASP
jgi:hypothetical protein